MKPMLKEIKRSKKGVSEMVGYVLLIAIGLGLAIGFYVWVSNYAEFNPKDVDCEDGTSLIIESYTCTDLGANPGIQLTMKNNGLFNIDGFIFPVGNNPLKTPVSNLIPNSVNPTPGKYQFIPPLKPGESRVVEFTNKLTSSPISYLDSINTTLVIPFIISKTKVGPREIICKNSVLPQQTINDCKIH
jgi:hypothetical protein